MLLSAMYLYEELLMRADLGLHDEACNNICFP